MNRHPLNPFSDVQASARRGREDGFEHRKVEYVCKQLGKQKSLRQMWDIIRDGGSLTFELQRQFFHLPVWLGCSTLPKLGCDLFMSNKAVFPIWLSRFGSLPIVPPYRELQQEADHGIPVGLIFPRKGFQQGLILHGGGQDFVAAGGSAIVWRDEAGELVVQSLATFVAHLRELI